jgi:hypothetical protein
MFATAIGICVFCVGFVCGCLWATRWDDEDEPDRWDY